MTDDLLDIDLFLRTATDRSWVEQAACRGMDTNIFFPERGDIKTMALAKKVCSTCPVTEQCYQYGEMERMGVWGGASTRQRERARGIRK